MASPSLITKIIWKKAQIMHATLTESYQHLSIFAPHGTNAFSLLLLLVATAAATVV